MTASTHAYVTQSELKYRRARYAGIAALFAALAFHFIGYEVWRLTAPLRAITLTQQDKKILAKLEKKRRKQLKESKRRHFVLTDLKEFEETVKPKDTQAEGLHSRVARQKKPDLTRAKGAPQRQGDNPVQAALAGREVRSQRPQKRILQKKRPLQKPTVTKKPTPQKKPAPQKKPTPAVAQARPKPPMPKIIKPTQSKNTPKILTGESSKKPPQKIAQKPRKTVKETPKVTTKPQPRQVSKPASRPAPPIKQIGRKPKVRGTAPRRNTRTSALVIGGDTMATLRARWPRYFEILRQKILESKHREEVLYLRTYNRGAVAVRFVVATSGKVGGVKLVRTTAGMNSEALRVLSVIQHTDGLPPLTPAMQKDPIFKDLKAVFYFR